jgi:hypothetical protein
MKAAPLCLDRAYPRRDCISRAVNHSSPERPAIQQAAHPVERRCRLAPDVPKRSLT